MILLLLLLAADPDLDRDGLKDRFEQDLLQRFLPAFQISRRECDVMPAEFAPGSIAPKAIARNGTIYGRVMPVGKDKIEIQYFHLWTRDCGLLPHALDVEHVAVLIAAKNRKQPAGKWKALTWYAGAHEDTLCNNSSGLPAATLDAVNKGARVWISRGKHASYLEQQRCAGGCRADDCYDSVPLRVTKIVNLGEPDHPLNGSLFVDSRRWRFRDKLQRADFELVE